ncbi:hypothetical protein A0H81_06537 [Grifola frondosa]|uniref:Versicolorin reductase n=1 Tax=Grifola frondosa TaxID=5627 RepID=A0A1C7MBI2_GRIFR|nr:hypothetical protein A0H81_06537 [Grifola frondosa]
MSLPLAGKVALITGSSRAIGAATATRLAADGANVVINYVSNAAAATSVADAINANGQPTPPRRGHPPIRPPRHPRAECGHHGEAAGLSDVDDKFFDDHFSINVKAPLFMVKAAAPLMKAGGRIIFFSSTLTHASTITPTTSSMRRRRVQSSRYPACSPRSSARADQCQYRRPGPIDTELFRSGKSEELIKFIGGFHP